MSALHPDLRRRLERDFIKARRLAEEGAAAALAHLGVSEAVAPDHLGEEEKELRRALRARGRQLGDVQERNGTQATRRLMLEGAYEHWHRLLFTRFLAENNLLVMADGTPVTLEDCEDPEILRMEDAPDGTALAMRYAARLLPQIFRPDDPLLRLTLAPEHLQPLRKLVADLPTAIFQADDALGWVYQFWRAEEKDAVNKAGDKIDADTISAVTQLFTEHYMVEFLLHNTLGAWWTAKVEASGGTSPIPLAYLRRKDDGSPAAGVFPGWPKTVRELRVLDPCCGSGHFLVALTQLLVAMLREEEGLGAEEAVRAVLGEILHGLELDARCTQLAAFNVGFAAWKLIGQPVELPPLRIACSGLSLGATREEWLAAVEKEDRYLIEGLYDLFKKAPELGSLINPMRFGFMSKKAADLLPAVRWLLAADPLANPERHELGVTAKGLADAAEILGRTFHVTATNVPYLGRGKQDEVLQEFCDKYHSDARSDLATAFVERCLAFCSTSGTVALVTPQNWLFLSTYREMRERLLGEVCWNAVARLGPRAFETITGEVVNVALVVLTRNEPLRGHAMLGIDVVQEKTAGQKDSALIVNPAALFDQAKQLNNPDAKVVFGEMGNAAPLGGVSQSFQGLKTGDDAYFRECFWEIATVANPWIPFQGTVSSNTLYSGKESVLRYERGGSAIARNQGTAAWGKVGIAVSQMSSLPSTIYLGDAFDSNVAPIIPKDPKILPALWVCCSSAEFVRDVRSLDPKVAVANGTFSQVPFDLAHWQRVAAEKYPNGLPKPQSDDATQWLFNGHPRGAVTAEPIGASAPLHVAVARLLGYRWPRQTGSEFPDCPALGPDGLEALADEDGIVCLAALRGERPAAERLVQLLAEAYDAKWKPAVLDHLLAAAGYGGRTLEEWLRDGFFEQHCQLFHQRPFVWQIWDGHKRGFSALVNYHQLDHAGLTKLIYSYLGDWISDRKRDVDAGVSGSDALHLAATQLQQKLLQILEGEPPYDIFVRWKPLEKQPLGWHPDLNDGVRLNIRPFVLAEVLRKKPKIKWGIDRGKNPPGAPWGETRDNDRHLTLAEKRRAIGK